MRVVIKKLIAPRIVSPPPDADPCYRIGFPVPFACTVGIDDIPSALVFNIG